MEEQLLSKFENIIHQNAENNHQTLSPQAQTIALSLITNPSTSRLTLSSLLKTLTLTLSSQNPNPNLLSLLSAVAHHHPHLRPEMSSAARTFYLLPSSPTHVLVDSLSLLFSIDNVTSDVADESLFLSLWFRPCKASVRQWLLKNACKFSVRPSVLLMVLLGFTKDPYPCTRKAALDGLVMLTKFIVVEDQSLVEGCYFRAVELLFDAEDFVRCSAVCAVSEWGNLLVVSNREGSGRDWSDAVFVQLCSMVRDMSMKVRLEAFEALGRVGMVSEDILLQTLSKKTTAATKEKNYPGQYTGKMFKVPASTAAFAFVHGLEDEYFEVRRSACHALRTLTMLSVAFAGEVVNLLMDVLNDDSIVVRLEVLGTMHHMAISDHLKVQEAHLHMLLGTLVDSSTLIRSGARKVLQLIKLHKPSLFRLCINGLIKNLELYPQDEADLFSVLFNIGQNHGKYVISIIQEASDEIEPSLGGKFGFDDAKTAALLVLAIAAPVSIEQRICTIPPRLYSYAVVILGRISRGLADIVNQNTLLAFLSHCSRFAVVSSSKFFDEGGQAFPQVEVDMQLRNEKLSDEIFEGHHQKILSPKEIFTQLLDDHLEVHDEVRDTVNVIFQKVKDMWQLIRRGCMDEVTRTLRSWKEELNVFNCNSSKPMGILVFTLQYLHVVELLGWLWSCFMCSRKLSSHGMGESELLFRNLEKSLMEMRYGFIGLSKEEQLHLLELSIVICTLRLCDVEACFPKPLIKTLNSTISRMEQIQEEGSCELPNFVSELNKQLHELSILTDGVLENPFQLQKALECFSLGHFLPSEELRHKEAALVVRDNDYQSPLPFIPGLPVGIPLEIELYNISNEDRLWVRMTIEDKLTWFVFLDLQEDENSSEERKFTFVAPFYSTPRAKYFSLRVCIVVECLSEDCYLQKDFHGPKYKLTQLCEEKEVHLSMVVR